MIDLQEIQQLLLNNDIESYYLTATKESPLAQLIIEVQTADQETNHLELCLIPTPDSEIFLLQLFMQLPLPPPFKPDDKIPEFIVPTVHHYLGSLNQILPLPGFYCAGKQMHFRHIFASQQPTEQQLSYIVETCSKMIQLCQPALQKVAIGDTPLQEAVETIPTLFDVEEESN